jgi:molecular chaperone DnaK (HSP70)
MVEAYKIVLRESASVRRAEDLARRMKQQQGITPTNKVNRIVDESIDRMKEDLEKALSALDQKENKTKVKLTRSRVETRVTISLFGSLEETEEKLQKIYKSICK